MQAIIAMEHGKIIGIIIGIIVGFTISVFGIV
jgi:hypothetical protein